MQPIKKEVIPEASQIIKGAPEWVNKGSRLLVTPQGRMFHGVAAAVPMGDLALQKAVADDRGRAEVTRVVSSWLDAVSAAYIASVRQRADGRIDTEAGRAAVHAEIASSQIRNSIVEIITGTRIIGSWREARAGNVWSIAELDFSQVKNAIEVTAGIDTDLKRFVAAEADNVFDSLANARPGEDSDS
jgi:hypothetical protein